MMRGRGHLAHAVVVLAVIAGLCLPCAAQAKKGLVAHYTFEEGPAEVVKDRSGNGNHGKMIDDVEYVKLEGGQGYALRFNSGKAHVDCGDKPSLDLRDALTIEMWFHPLTRVRKGEGGVVGKVMGSYSLSYSGKCWFYVPGGSNYGSTAPLSMSWQHVVATFDGGEVKMYVDGKLLSSQKSKVKKLPKGENFYLRYPATYLNVEPDYKCMMDEVRVYNRALSGRQVIRSYQRQAKARGVEGAVWFDRVKVTPHLFPQSGTVVVEADYGKMGLRSAGSVLKMELRRAAGGGAIETHEMQVKVALPGSAGKKGPVRFEFKDLERLGAEYWTVSVKDAAPGDYAIRATVAGRNGKRIGQASSVNLRLPLEKPEWIKAYNGAKVLNNFVASLLEVERTSVEAEAEYRFVSPRAGWVFLSSTAPRPDGGRVLLYVDSVEEGKAVIVHGKGTKEETLEAMRHLPAGEHKVLVRCDGPARPSRLVVRAIPEMMVAGLGYTRAPILPCFGYYNMEYLERIGLLDNINVIIERSPRSEDAPYVKAWRAAGKKMMVRFGMWPIWQKGVGADGIFKAWTENRGLGSPDYHGIIADEFSGLGHGGPGNYPLYGEVTRRIRQDPRFEGKVFYPYCMPMYYGETAMGFLKDVVDAGYKWAGEKYNVEQPTEKAARAFLDMRLRQDLLRYHEAFPGCARHMIPTLGFMSAPPETLNVDPRVDFKVYMDMQMHLLATDPLFFGLYGLQWYHNGYADEEDLRWSARLLRHYGIEGKTERLTSDPYILSHIQNPDFDDGASGWTVARAEPGSITARQSEGFGALQTRIRRGGFTGGDRCLVTRRSAKAPNRFSQKIMKLTTGRQYSVKMFTADYDELKKGKSTARPHYVSIKIEGVDLIAGKEFHQPFASGRAGHTWGPFNRENNLYVTYHRVVFRAKGPDALLTISDWAADDAPGGPVGRRLMHNFIEVQPYLEDPSFVPPAAFIEDYWMVMSRRKAAAEKGEAAAADPVPVAHYRFNEGEGDTARNAAPQGKVAKIHGAGYVKAGEGHALSFDGADDYVRATDRAAVNIAGGNLSVECWFKVKDAKATWRGLLGNYHSGTGGYMLVYTSEGIAFYNGAKPGGPSGKVNVKDGKWHHALGVVDNGTMILYLDGVQVPGVSPEEVVKSSTYPFEIGRYGLGKSFSGEIDEVAVYARALSVPEIKRRYTSGRR